MGFFRKKEERAETGAVVQFDEALLSAITGGGSVTKEMALQIPSVSGGIDLIANIIAGTPIKLYQEQDGKVEEVKGDRRVRLLNDDTGDTLNASEFWRAMVRDYYTGKGGYAYIRKENGRAAGLHYVDERHISILRNTDPIFKDHKIMVNGVTYESFDFLRLLRNTKDGAEGIPITVENGMAIETAYESMKLERNMARRGGSKRGFLKSEKRIDQAMLDALRNAFRRLYGGDNTDNFVVLNNGVDFKESSDTAAEMQLRENKEANAQEFAKLFHIPVEAMSGKASEADTASLARLAAIPLMGLIQCALNRDLLLEREKDSLYFAFDTKALLRGDMKSRFAAYKTALEANFMQIDEVRYEEDMEPLGLSWIKLGLQDVLYDPKTKQIYTPNTGLTGQMGSLQVGGQRDMMEARGTGQPRDEKGRFKSTGKKKKRRKSTRSLLGSIRMTNFPKAKAGDRMNIYTANVAFDVLMREDDTMDILSYKKLK